MDVLILNTQDGDWQAMYINGKLIDEGHTLGDGNNFYYLLEKSEEYGFKRKNVRQAVLNDYDNDQSCLNGNLPDNISEFNGKY